MAFSIYLGLTNPRVEAVINAGMREFLDHPTRNGGGHQHPRTLDPRGQSLSLWGGRGNFRAGMHNAFERELAEVGRTCGLDVTRQDSEVFGTAIPVGPQRDAYGRAVRANARTGGNRGGLVPDFSIRNFPTADGALPRTRLYEVKTIGHKPELYGVPSAVGSPVTRRDARIAGEYETLARRADARYCGTMPGTDGPLLLRLRALAPVNGLVVGANGEWSRGVDTFITDVSRVASANPERFGCCHGPEQARGVIAAMARDRLGRVALRGAAQVGIAALLAITGQPGVEPGSHRHHTHGTHDEWDRARDHTSVPFTRGG
jgi:hypothetical protein